MRKSAITRVRWPSAFWCRCQASPASRAPLKRQRHVLHSESLQGAFKLPAIGEMRPEFGQYDAAHNEGPVSPAKPQRRLRLGKGWRLGGEYVEQDGGVDGRDHSDGPRVSSR